jgi:hypothetical protein
MTDKKLVDLLEEIHGHLNRRADLDADAKRLVQVVLADLKRVGVTDEHHRSLQELAVAFEMDHPDVAGALRRLAVLLAGAGV